MVHVTWGIVIACGRDEQIAEGVYTPFLDLVGKPVLTYSLLAFERCPEIDAVLVMAAGERVDSVRSMKQMYGCAKVRRVLAGTTQRQSSMAVALRALDEDISMVVTHDASRPLFNSEPVAAVLKSAKRYGSGVTAARAREAIKQAHKGTTVTATLGPDVWVSMTPQAFRREWLCQGYEAAARKKQVLADDSAALELTGKEIRLVEAASLSIRIRGPADLKLAMALAQP